MLCLGKTPLDAQLQSMNDAFIAAKLFIFYFQLSPNTELHVNSNALYKTQSKNEYL